MKYLATSLDPKDSLEQGSIELDLNNDDDDAEQGSIELETLGQEQLIEPPGTSDAVPSSSSRAAPTDDRCEMTLRLLCTYAVIGATIVRFFSLVPVVIDGNDCFAQPLQVSSQTAFFFFFNMFGCYMCFLWSGAWIGKDIKSYSALSAFMNMVAFWLDLFVVVPNIALLYVFR